MTQFVQPICLWDDDENPSAGDNGTVVGFGFNEKNEVSEVLQEATLTMVDGLECLELDRHSYGPVLTSKMFCAGGRPGVSACKGDSGGGMFFTKNNTWYILGIVAFIPVRYDASCDSTKYTVFTKVSKYHQWILGAMTRSNFKDLEPCEDNFVASKTMCNVANKYDHSFLLVGHTYGIRRVPMNGGNVVEIINGSDIVKLDHDCSNGRVYWINYPNNEFWSSNYDGTDMKRLNEVGIYANDVAVDWISRRLYWSDIQKDAVFVANLDNPDLRSVLMSNLKGPTSITVDPYREKLYWIEGPWSSYEIVSSNLDGTERQILTRWPDIRFPKSIKVSRITGELCYTELGRIDCIDTKGKKTRTVGSDLLYPHTLAVTDDSFYLLK
ncbi:hypothetical protein ZHAS_00016280 [Anopheles sinensis]|uniref:Peptidase S1 domain-containing protein n=1 Tax=Anopheles sinensis TaxID=74873 RepID=A0A084WDK7_ANOSI|nr:hypothetical protein ZHAS_00016280 [Anopheles sinensis]